MLEVVLLAFFNALLGIDGPLLGLAARALVEHLPQALVGAQVDQEQPQRAVRGLHGRA